MLLDTLGSTARVAHVKETAATTEIKPPDAEFDELHFCERAVYGCAVKASASSRPGKPPI